MSRLWLAKDCGSLSERCGANFKDLFPDEKRCGALVKRVLVGEKSVQAMIKRCGADVKRAGRSVVSVCWTRRDASLQ